MPIWDPWTGCRQYSAGCQNCYYYGRYYGGDAAPPEIKRGEGFGRPLEKKKNGAWKMASGTVNTCFKSDFLLEEADEWRAEAWETMRQRQDLRFMFLTKRITRLAEVWPQGLELPNLSIGCTVENQQAADERLPALLAAPVASRFVALSPLLGQVDIEPYLDGRIQEVACGGESGKDVRECRYEWVLNLRDQCVRTNTPFTFRQTGSCFVKDGETFHIPYRQQYAQARKAGLKYPAGKQSVPTGR